MLSDFNFLTPVPSTGATGQAGFTPVKQKQKMVSLGRPQLNGLRIEQGRQNY